MFYAPSSSINALLVGISWRSSVSRFLFDPTTIEQTRASQGRLITENVNNRWTGPTRSPAKAKPALCHRAGPGGAVPIVAPKGGHLRRFKVPAALQPGLRRTYD